jgi:hypothetical protein
MNNTLKAFTIAICLGTAGGCSPTGTKTEWRRNRTSGTDTFYPGVSFGMTRDQVRGKIPSSYSVSQEGNKLVAERKPPGGGTKRINFFFDGGKLISTQDTNF